MESKTNLQKGQSEKNRTKKEKRQRRLMIALLVLLFTSFFIYIIGIIAVKIWTDSGTGEWKEAYNRNGVLVYTQKDPGSFLLKMRAIKTMKSTLSAFIATMQDVEAMCTEGCYDAIIVKRIDTDSTQIVYTDTRFEMPFPFKDREWILENIFTQDSLSKEIIYQVNAAPDIIPPNKKFIRMTHFNNSWRFTPLENGLVEVEWYVDMDHNNFFVNLLHNLVLTNVMDQSLMEIEEMVIQEKYQNARFDFVREVNDEPK